MKITLSPVELRAAAEAARQAGQSVGFVPTMGSLHAGHRALCQACVNAHPLSVVSIFVNPLQFAPGEDFNRYPRGMEADQRLLDEVGISLLFTPDAASMYPSGFQTCVDVEKLSALLDGQFRPGHFRGVATVVLKLFNIVGPCHAYFGEKDFQQLQILQRMVQDLDVPITIHSLPTVREPDGLAMSSRNRYLNDAERRAAPAIYRSLAAAKAAATAGTISGREIVAAAAACISEEPLLHPEYIALVDPETLQPVETLEREARLAIAARIGSARLIDNIEILPNDDDW